jgi:hypothetical protein
MTATHDMNPTLPTTPVLYLSHELGQKNWELAFTVGLGQKSRLRTIAAGDTAALRAEIAVAKKRFGLPEGAAVAACYEARRDSLPMISPFSASSLPANLPPSHLHFEDDLPLP